MSIKEMTMYAVQCDEPGCSVDTAELGGDFSGWADAGYAEDEWISSDQQMFSSIDGKTLHYCEKHRKPVCDDCELQVASVNDDRLCEACAAKENE